MKGIKTGPWGLIALLGLAGCLSVRLPKAQIRPLESEKVVGWQGMVGEALENNPDLDSARFALESRARARDIAFGDYLPSVSGNLDKGRARSSGSPAHDSLSLSVEADQALFTGFETTGNFISARKDLEAARFDYQDTSANVRFRLRSAYIELLRLKDLLDVSKRIEQRRRNNAELIQLRYEAGREHLGSLMRAKAIAERAAFVVRQTDRRIETQSLRLEREMGGEFELPLQVEGTLDTMVPVISGLKPDPAELAEETPAVQRAMKTAESFKALVLSSQGELWPHVDGSYDYEDSGTRASDLKSGSFLGLRASVPFFNGGKNVNGIRRAEANYRAAREDARSVRDETLTQLAEAWAQLTDAVEFVEVQKNFLEAARKRSEIVRSEYTAGLVNFQDFDIAEQDLADSENNYVESLAAVLSREASWQLARGATLEDAAREI
ncbi:MAG TPA: TolC family protein [Verrucomicrobiae bacterium]|jgi:outer membrane protein TolC|nr:TolC family protein [Verrucomicrobiae bacterium]